MAACHGPSQMGGIGGANANWLSRQRLLLCSRLRRRVLVALVFFEQAFQQGDGIEEGIVELDEQVDVVEVFLAAEAVGQVVLRVDSGPHFAAMRAQEAEVAIAHFRGRTVAARGEAPGPQCSRSPGPLRQLRRSYASFRSAPLRSVRLRCLRS